MCRQPMAAQTMPPCKYFRQSLADAMGAPLEAMVRVGNLQGATREPSLEQALLHHERATAEKAALPGGAPAKRARRSDNEPSRGDENAPEHRPPGHASLSLRPAPNVRLPA